MGHLSFVFRALLAHDLGCFFGGQPGAGGDAVGFATQTIGHGVGFRNRIRVDF